MTARVLTCTIAADAVRSRGGGDPVFAEQHCRGGLLISQRRMRRASSPVFLCRPRVSPRRTSHSSLPKEGSGAPADAGACEAPGGWPARPSGGTLGEGVPFLLAIGGRRLPALHTRRSATGGPRFRERGPATPVSQLLAAGPSACERSPAIARAPE